MKSGKKCLTAKKVLSAVLSAAMVLGLSACGNTQTSDGSNATQSGASDGQTQGGDIYWYSAIAGWGPGNWNGTDTSPLLDTLKEKYGITLTIEQPPTDANTKLGLMIASDDLPDVISTTDADVIKQLVASGKVWDLGEFFTQYDPESHLLQDFPEDIKQVVISNYGGWYSLPSHLNSDDTRKLYPPCSEVYEDLVTKASNGAIMFNQTIMNELGITQEDVQTEQGFYEACEKVKNSGYQIDGQSVIPVVLHGDLWIDSSLDYVLAPNFGAVQVDENGNYRNIVLSPGYKNALKFVNNCIQKGYLDLNTLTIDENALKTEVESGRVFCWIGNCAQSGKKETVPFVSFGPIVADNGARPVMGVNKAAGAGWIQTFVSKDCENPELVAKMLSFGTSTEGLRLNDYGIEGEDYTIDDKGVITRTEAGAERFVEVYKSNMALWPFANTCFTRYSELPAAEGTDGAAFNQIATAMGKYETTYIYNSALTRFEGSTVLEPSSNLGINYSQIQNYLKSQKATIVAAPSDEEFEKEYNNMVDELNKYQITEIDAEYDKKLKESESEIGDVIEDVNASLYE